MQKNPQKTISFISLMTSTTLGINTFGGIQLSSCSPSHLFLCVFLFLADPLRVSSRHVAQDKHSLSAHQRNSVCRSHVVHLQCVLTDKLYKDEVFQLPPSQFTMVPAQHSCCRVASYHTPARGSTLPRRWSISGGYPSLRCEMDSFISHFNLTRHCIQVLTYLISRLCFVSQVLRVLNAACR